MLTIERVAFPRRGEAWLDLSPDGSEDVRALLERACAAGARVVRTALPADAEKGRHSCEKAGMVPVTRWVVREGFEAGWLPQAPQRLDPGARARRFSGGGWHNARVRLALQLAVERAGWGLVSVAGAVLPLVSFGPFGLQEEVARGGVVTAGDPAHPLGVMFLDEIRRNDRSRLVLRRLSGAPRVFPSFLEYVRERSAANGDAKLDISLPAAQAEPAAAWFARSDGLRPLVVYEHVER